MNILGIETSCDACSAAILANGRIAERFEIAPRRHTELILPMVESLFKESSMNMADIDAIGFGCGPGAFTGIRIAAGIVQGLALAFNTPVIPISSLRCIAYEISERHAHDNILVANDARMNEIYWGLFRRDKIGNVLAIEAEKLTSPEALQVPESVGWVATGSAWENFDLFKEPYYKDALQNIYSDVYPQARDVVALAAFHLASNDVKPCELAQPVYLRNKIVG